MAYVYSHHKADTKEVFYIGIGASEDGRNVRAYDKNKRSRFWKAIVKKHGFYAEIIAEGITWESAIEIEIELISKYGRINNDTGCLCNLTDGGEGCKGFVVTPEYREKLSKALKGRPGKFGKDNHFFGKTHSDKAKEKLSAALKATEKNKGVNNPNYGKPLSEEQKAAISKANTGRKHTEEAKIRIRAWGKGKPKSDEWKAKVRGENNGFYGKGLLQSGDKNPRAKPCIYIETGESFSCLKTACQAKNLSYDTQRIYLNPEHKRHGNRKFNYS